MLRSILFSVSLCCSLLTCAAAAPGTSVAAIPRPGKPAYTDTLPAGDTWKGFRRTYLEIAGHRAWYVAPATPLEGKPWIWKAVYADWHTDMDSLLLVKGFYLAYISVDDQFGSPYAMQVWDRYYHYLTDTLSLSPRPALEGISRGGLYVYAWAKRNPDKVSCIYCEAPVCDIRSWPAGKKGRGLGDSAAWRQFQQVFQLEEKVALAFDGNPIDHLEGLASFKIPLLHIVSNEDQYAPPEENSYPLMEKYLRLGGPMSVYPVTAGPQELKGHHFPIREAGRWARWVFEQAYPVQRPLPYGHYFTARNGLSHAYEAIALRKKARVAFLGGSITFNPGWRPKICAWLKESFPATEFHFIAAGIPSLGSVPHAFRLQKDILDSGKVDLLFVEAAVNDRGNEVDSSTEVRALEGIVRHARNSNPSMDIVLMSFSDQLKNADYNKGYTPWEVANHELVAQHYGLPSINLAKEINDKINHKEFTWADDFKDIHPSPFGQELYFATMKELLRTALATHYSPLTKDPAASGSPRPNPSIPPSPNQQSSSAPLDKFSFTNGKMASPALAVYDKGWTLDKDWTPSDSLSTRPGYVHVPMLVSTTPGAALTFTFSGSALGMGITSGADAGIIVYSIDGSAEKKIDLYTQWSSWLHLPWYILFAGDLGRGRHTLKLRIDNSKNNSSKGNACRIVHFLVNEPPRS